MEDFSKMTKSELADLATDLSARVKELEAEPVGNGNGPKTGLIKVLSLWDRDSDGKPYQLSDGRAAFYGTFVVRVMVAKNQFKTTSRHPSVTGFAMPYQAPAQDEADPFAAMTGGEVDQADIPI